MTRHRRLHLILSIVLFSSLVSCSRREDELHIQADPRHPNRYICRFKIMGTDASIIVRGEDITSVRQSISPAVSRLQSIERTMSTYRDDSEISRLNASGHASPIRISKTTMQILRKAQKMYRLTDGAFDITYAPLRSLWRRAEKQKRRPSEEDINRTLSHVGNNQLILRDGTAQLAQKGVEIDPGGIAKGFAIDQAIHALQEAGIQNALVEVGGDLRVLGHPNEEERWRIEMRDPRPGKHEPIILQLHNEAVATSGDYHRFFRIDDQKFSHIIDPRTGYPVRRVPSATVISQRALQADALATAISVMNLEKGLHLVNTLDGVECLIVTREGTGTSDHAETHYSDGFLSRVEQ
ncbi:MAG: FAD:protein FMN transferase [Planctomycetota bacterium]